MLSVKNTKLLSFSFLTLIFAVISFFFRNILIANYNNSNFKLFTVDYIKNYGAAFSLFHTHTSFLIVISVIILLFALYYIYKYINEFSKSDVFFSALLCAGIICNLSERLLDGFVTDYIRLNFVIFPIFNVSDMFISIGAFILICNILFSNDQTKD